MDTLEKLKKKRAELDKKIEELEYAEFPFKEGDTYWMVRGDGNISGMTYCNNDYHKKIVMQGSAFHTYEEAEKEIYRRDLLSCFKMFRDKCNGGWKADFKNFDRKYFIVFNAESQNVLVDSRKNYDYLNLFGCFKNESDARKAIELFGDEIKRLYVGV